MIILNTLILLLAYILFSYIYIAIHRPKYRSLFSVHAVPQALHRMHTDEAQRFFKEFDDMEATEYSYRPWVEFSERVFHAPRLNVDQAAPVPVRRTIPSASDRTGQPLIVWMFGGSTTFGYGVPDEETIPSHLQAILSRDLPTRAVVVTNHGHSSYYSSQELALFQVSLRRGERCDVAIFLDGLNDARMVQDVPFFTDRISTAVDREEARNPTLSSYVWISPDFPPLRVLPRVKTWFKKRALISAELSTSDLVGRYRFNISSEAALGNMGGTKTIFFWQPVPDTPPYAPARELAGKVRQAVEDASFHSIADIFKGSDPRDVYVDREHYGDTACGHIAEAIEREVLAVTGH